MSRPSPMHVVERGFDIRGSRWWDETVADLRYAVRLLRKQKSFAAAALATIALGSGANVAVYSALHAVILAPLSYTSPDRLIVLRQQQVKAGRDRLDFSVAEMAGYRQGTSASHRPTNGQARHRRSFCPTNIGDGVSPAIVPRSDNCSS
jgi:hypothetical protein